jgi:ABC-type sugar transport system substrate-binding protein
VTIGFATLWSSVPAVSNVNRGFAAQAEAMGATAKVIEAKISDPLNTQLADMDQLIAQGVDALAFWPLDDNAYNAVLKRAQEKGIPVFAHDAYAPNLLTQVVTSVTQGRALRAKQGADLICQKLGPAGGEVLYGNFAVAIPTLTFLKEQFTSALAQCPNPVKLVGEFANKTDDVDGGRTAAEAALLAHPEVKAVFNYNDATAIGTAQAASSLNRRDGLWIDGYNLGQDGIDALKSGRIDASWDYRGVQIGQEIARLMIDHARDDSAAPPKVVMVWPKGYTKANIDTLETPDQLLDKVSQGVDLLAAEPTLTSSGSEILTPPADIPSPPLP